MDLRVRKTYQALIGACTELLSRNRFEDVTIAMLCEEAMIRRTTFYKHFADKAEFFSFYVESLKTELVERGRLAADKGDSDDVAEGDDAERTAILAQLSEYLLDHEALMDNIFASSMSGMMLLVVCEKIAEAFKARALGDESAPTMRPDDLEMRCEFAAGGVVRALLLWWETPDRRAAAGSFVQTSAHLAGRILDE
ncbi:MAG: TetR/AcrR family transcriptional regulator [Collinsella sp.]|nr:TetR/AcrR family transcriptional regulator [Collinsella sp.]